MAKKNVLKKKTFKESISEEIGAPISDDEKESESVEETVGQDSVEDQEKDSKYMNQDEAKALSEKAKDIEEDKNKVSTVKMEKAVALVQDTFNLADKKFVVNAFTDSGMKCKLSLSNADYELSITIKDTEKYDIY